MYKRIFWKDNEDVILWKAFTDKIGSFSIRLESIIEDNLFPERTEDSLRARIKHLMKVNSDYVFVAYPHIPEGYKKVPDVEGYIVSKDGIILNMKTGLSKNYNSTKVKGLTVYFNLMNGGNVVNYTKQQLLDLFKDDIDYVEQENIVDEVPIINEEEVYNASAKYFINWLNNRSVPIKDSKENQLDILMQKKGIQNIEELAAITGLNLAYINSIKEGSNIFQLNLKILCRFLDCTSKELLEF